jgi:hypothetical protein
VIDRRVAMWSTVAVDSSTSDGNILSDESTLPSPGTKTEERLQPDDVIEYYNPIGVAGDEHWFRTATVVGIDPNDRSPLNLDNGEYLPCDHLVKKIKMMVDGKLVDHAKGRFRSIEDYILVSGGTMELVGLKSQIKQASRVREDIEEEANNFWQQQNETTELWWEASNFWKAQKEEEAGLITEQEKEVQFKGRKAQPVEKDCLVTTPENEVELDSVKRQLYNKGKTEKAQVLRRSRREKKKTQKMIF